MSNLAEAITKLMDRRGIRFAAEIAKRSQLQESAISRWLNGIQISISDEDLERLARAISPEPRDQAELVAARMLDARTGPGAELVSVQISGEPLRDPAPRFGRKLAPHVQRDFDLLAEHYLEDSDLRDVLSGLANIIREKKGDEEQSLVAERPGTKPVNYTGIPDQPPAAVREGKPKRPRRPRASDQ